MHTPEALEAARLQDEESRKLFELRQKGAAEPAQDDGAAADIEAGSEATGAAKKRVRVSAPKRMINPFGAEVSPEVSAAQVAELLARFGKVDTRSMHIDVGCARGKCIANLARKYPGWNHLGVEIRNDLCLTAVEEYIGEQREDLNLYFLGCNFALSADAILSGLPQGIRKLVSFQVCGCSCAVPICVCRLSPVLPCSSRTRGGEASTCGG
jgi:hypothetical protein